MNSENEEKGRRRKMRQGTQYDAMKKVRKEMPPSTRIIEPKIKRPSNNWRDYLNELDDLDDGSEYEKRD